MELPPGYAAILEELKDQIRRARIKAALAVNRELVLLYWSIGRQILKAAAGGGLGLQGHRPAVYGSPAGVSGDEGLLAKKSEVHEEIC